MQFPMFGLNVNGNWIKYLVKCPLKEQMLFVKLSYMTTRKIKFLRGFINPFLKACEHGSFYAMYTDLLFFIQKIELCRMNGGNTV